MLIGFDIGSSEANRNAHSVPCKGLRDVPDYGTKHLALAVQQLEVKNLEYDGSKHLVTTSTTHVVFAPKEMAQSLCESEQDLIPHLMSKAVIDSLEIVEIKRKENNGLTSSICSNLIPFEGTLESSKVRQARQGIRRRLYLEATNLFLRVLKLSLKDHLRKPQRSVLRLESRDSKLKKLFEGFEATLFASQEIIDLSEVGQPEVLAHCHGRYAKKRNRQNANYDEHNFFTQ